MAAGLINAANQLLAGAVTILGAAAPARRFVSVGPPAYDCDQLTVHCSAFGVAATSPRLAARDDQARRVVLYEATLDLTILRCYSTDDAEPSILDPNMRLPSASSLQTIGVEVYSDVWKLWTGLWAALHAGSLFTDGGYCRGRSLGQAVPVPEQGALAGWIIPVTVELSGADG